MGNLPLIYFILLLVIIFLADYLISTVNLFNIQKMYLYEAIDIEDRCIDEKEFAAIKESGVEIAYISVSQGLNSKEHYKEKIENAKKAGLYVGLYHTIMAQKPAAAKREAQYFVTLIKDMKMDCRIAIRVFEYGNLSAAQLNEILKIFIDVLEEEGFKIILYSDEYMAEKYIHHSFTVYPLWIVKATQLKAKIGSWPYYTGIEYTGAGEIAGLKNAKLSHFNMSILL